jgi:RND family efflux transporter MFP subunit
VLLGYTVIRSPYDGVVTRRNFHPGKDGRPGDYIKSADHGGTVPLLTVERTDLMRVVVQVPERDVAFVDLGDPAAIELDALPGVALKTNGADKVAISRLAASEDPHTRMMRIEVHVKNPTGKLRRGMYGRVTLILQTGSPEAVRIPSSALHGKAEGGRASVRVVRDDIAHIVPVRYGIDNGTEVEILSGLTAADRVVVRANGPIDNGTQVSMSPASSSKSGH